MRLLNCATLELEEWVQSPPRYAILSHTWSDNEVTLEDMKDLSKARQMKGYAKIQATCQMAMSQGIRYAWIDTCCIDKSSSAELSEAINSMFALYQGSTVCYVFLSDYRHAPDFEMTEEDIVDSFKTFTDVERGFSDPLPLTSTQVDIRLRIRKALGKCRWFYRGWTLQELIAPRVVEFYDQNWFCFGSKLQLAPILSWITSIDEAVLNGSPLDQVLVGRRMSWAANRQTRRVEDMAYCLFGIFDINLPLLYGEGNKAFIRLQEEIVRSSNDLSIFAWTATMSDHRAFRSLWASSPSEFKSCRWLVKPAIEWNGGGEYGMTSRGLRTLNMIRIVRGVQSRTGSYFLPLDCVDAREPKNIRFVSLEQYGPSLFARRKPWLYDTVVDLEVSRASKLPQPQFICCKESSDLNDMVKMSRVESVKIELSVETMEILEETSVVAHPEIDWDFRNSILLSYRRPQFWGYWKIRTIVGGPGICIVCAHVNGWPVYGVFAWDQVPAGLEQSDLLPSRVADILLNYNALDRTSATCHPWRHTVDLSSRELDVGGKSVPYTVLQIRSERLNKPSQPDDRKSARRIIRRLFNRGF
ncbi:heterokaryon incompatibility protein-domain-containing protein [Poronia punctata]|nr:heterokaryon incompatibility protein-domain-containing protein [Poronia punctata]